MAEFDRLGLPMMGGCQVCQASIAAYNACPTATGNLSCTNCVGAEGFATVDQAAKEFLDRLRDRLVDVSRSTQAQVIHSDHIGDGLVNYIESNQVDLVVVGETSRGGFERLVLGSTTRFVLRHAPSSVLIARGRSMEDFQTGQMVHQTAAT